jgi:prepilin-type N-terminal cleavage/methylation domain-containing protein
MSDRNQGFTLVELIVTIFVTGLLSAFTYAAFNTSIINYFGLQKQSINFTDLALQTQRLASVLRGATDITSATTDDITLYSYFSPADSYVSKVHYYKNSAQTKLFVDVTRMTANPPIGTEIISSAKTYTILDNYTQVSGNKLFTYLDATGNTLSAPISDLHTIKGIRVSLASPSSTNNSTQSISLQISLRNRKTNL